MRLLECVPNVSEGRRPEVIDAIAGAYEDRPGVHLLDRHSDPDHHRSVLTVAGERGPLVEAVVEATRVAAGAIDLTDHAGVHPRMGATDVVPFVPLGETTMAEAVEAAREAAERIAGELEIPVYLYGEAAEREERARLAEVRRGGFEALREAIGEDPARRPDRGPARIHPTAGATAVGARFFLIAFNVRLETDDLALARSIAADIRESGGGLPGVQALGFPLARGGGVQVSMNLVDHRRTAMGRAYLAVAERAREAGVRVGEAEIVGLVPRAAVDRSVGELLGHDDAPPVLEGRLEEALVDGPISGFLEKLGSTRPAPGGGAAAALGGGLAAALVAKVTAIALPRTDGETRKLLQAIRDEARELAGTLQAAMPRDAKAFERVAAAWKLPKEAENRDERIQEASADASGEARRIADLAKRARELAGEAEPHVSAHLKLDLQVATHLAEAAMEGAGLLAES